MKKLEQEAREKEQAKINLVRGINARLTRLDEIKPSVPDAQVPPLFKDRLKKNKKSASDHEPYYVKLTRQKHR